MRSKISLFIAVFTLGGGLLLPSLTYAQIYKWVDENGQVHFSDKKAQAGKHKVKEVKVQPSINTIPKINVSNQLAEDVEETNSDTTKKPTAKKPLRSKHKKGEATKVDYRCLLAQKIINGEVHLSNWLPTSQKELEVAKRDIKKFCK